jgi:hypothetical protein
MKRNETATPRESERGSEQGESSARLAQLQALVMGLTRQVERKEEEEDTLRRTLELREMQMESALSTMGRVENLTDQVKYSKCIRFKPNLFSCSMGLPWRLLDSNAFSHIIGRGYPSKSCLW